MLPACARVLATAAALGAVVLASSQRPPAGSARDASPSQLTMRISIDQPPLQQERPPARAGTGLVLGRVLDGFSSTPVADALVTLTAGGGAVKVITDAQGRFLFMRVADGLANIVASKSGYLDGRFGQPSPRGPGRLLSLPEGARVGDAVVRLWRLAGVSGAVHDDAGDPAVNVEVRLIERVAGDGSERVLAQTPAAAALTDDRGMYRFGAVVPGEYIVMARSPSEMAMRVLIPLAMSDMTAVAAFAQRASAAANRIDSLIDLDSTLRLVAPAFHGGAAPADAQPIRLRAGEERRGVNLAVTAVPVARVAGTVFQDGKPVAQTRVRLTLPESDVEVANATSDQSGQFAMIGVPSGVYTLRALRDVRGGRGTTPAQPVLWVRQQIVAGSAESTSLVVVMQPAPAIRGRIEFTGGGAPPTADELRQMRISFVAPGAAGNSRSAQVQPDGTFDTGGLVPARYRLELTSLQSSRQWRPVSATDGATDLLDGGADLDADLDNVVVVVASDPAGRIDGIVTTPQGTPDSGAVVVVLPADPDRFSSRRLRTAYTSADGSYVAPMLPAGHYAVAVSTAERVEYGFDRDEILRLIQTGTRITVADGDRHTVNLRSGGR